MIKLFLWLPLIPLASGNSPENEVALKSTSPASSPLTECVTMDLRKTGNRNEPEFCWDRKLLTAVNLLALLIRACRILAAKSVARLPVAESKNNINKWYRLPRGIWKGVSGLFLTSVLRQWSGSHFDGHGGKLLYLRIWSNYSAHYCCCIFYHTIT